MREARARLRRMAFLRAGVRAHSVLSGLYFGVFAAGRYVSETAFVVRGVSSSRSSGLEALFRSFGIARTVDDTNIVETYLVSRDALRDLAAALPLREMYARPEADLLSRYPRPDPGRRVRAIVRLLSEPGAGRGGFRARVWRTCLSKGFAPTMRRRSAANC